PFFGRTLEKRDAQKVENVQSRRWLVHEIDVSARPGRAACNILWWRNFSPFASATGAGARPPRFRRSAPPAVRRRRRHPAGLALQSAPLTVGALQPPWRALAGSSRLRSMQASRLRAADGADSLTGSGRPRQAAPHEPANAARSAL